MDFDRDDFSVIDPKEEIVNLLNQEMGGLRRRLTEAKAQLDTMQTQVDREQTRYSGIAMELRNIKDNIDMVPKSEIREKYEEALEVRFRLATMRGQLEKIESSYSDLEQKKGMMDKILTLLQGVDSLSSGNDTGNGGNDEIGFDIIGIINTQEDERLRLSRAIHDSIAQSLTNFILQAEICQRFFDRNPERAAQELNDLKTSASSTFQKVREFIFDLRPMMLDDLGVAPTVRRYVDSYGEKNDIDTKIDISGDDRRLENYKEVLIFRSIQDLLTMARDYASPTEVNIKLDLNGAKVKFTVEDDGRPFDPQKVTSKDVDNTDARVQALRMLKNRLELVGATINMNSTENDGSTIRVEIPAGEPMQ
jgi:two-component system, NarL family, sensor histidine kinase DegS